MLYILGGASRSGKTLLARRVVAEKAIPYFPLDALFGALANGAPELGITYDQAFIERAERMWPLTKQLLNFFFEEEQDYLIEGDSILPAQIKELQEAGKPIKACFMGYTAVGAQEKLALVRGHHQGELDWTKEIPDDQMLGMVNEMIEFSTYLEGECAKYGIRYLDVSHDFDGAREQAFEALFKD